MPLLRLIDQQGERWLMLWLYCFVVVVITLEVIRRFVLDYSSVWGEEAVRYAFIYLTWIGAAAAIKAGAHIRIDILLNVMPPRGQASLNMLSHACAIIFAVFAFRLSVEPVLVSFNFGSVTDGLRVTRGWFLLSVPFGFALVLLRAVQALIQDFKDLRAGSVSARQTKLFD